MGFLNLFPQRYIKLSDKLDALNLNLSKKYNVSVNTIRKWENKTDFEVYPNLIISVTTANKIAQQVHYIINKNLNGIFHLSSNDMIHHLELFEELSKKLELNHFVFKNIYTSNKDKYLAILAKHNKLPKNYQINISEIIEDCVLKEEIESLR